MRYYDAPPPPPPPVGHDRVRTGHRRLPIPGPLHFRRFALRLWQLRSVPEPVPELPHLRPNAPPPIRLHLPERRLPQIQRRPPHHRFPRHICRPPLHQLLPQSRGRLHGRGQLRLVWSHRPQHEGPAEPTDPYPDQHLDRRPAHLAHGPQVQGQKQAPRNACIERLLAGALRHRDGGRRLSGCLVHAEATRVRHVQPDTVGHRIDPYNHRSTVLGRCQELLVHQHHAARMHSLHTFHQKRRQRRRRLLRAVQRALLPPRRHAPRRGQGPADTAPRCQLHLPRLLRGLPAHPREPRCIRVHQHLGCMLRRWAWVPSKLQLPPGV